MTAIRIGFFGKLPSRGDFVCATLPRALTQAWDRWLQPLMPAAQKRLGDAWRDVWWATRPWRFSLPPGLCGMAPVSGVWLASADKVGRDFPLTIAAEAPPCPRFLDAAEELGLEAIDCLMPPDALTRRLGAVPRPSSSPSIDRGHLRWWRRGGGEAEGLHSERLPDLDGFIAMLTP